MEQVLKQGTPATVFAESLQVIEESVSTILLQGGEVLIEGVPVTVFAESLQVIVEPILWRLAPEEGLKHGL